MKNTIKLISLASLLLLGMTGCAGTIPPNTDPSAIPEEHTASISEEVLTEEEITAIKKGATLPGESNNAIIYDQQKMLLTYQGTSSCPDHPESVTTENSTLKIKFTDPDPEKMCAAVMTGPFTKVIDLPANFSRKENIRVYIVMGDNEMEIPVVIN